MKTTVLTLIVAATFVAPAAVALDLSTAQDLAAQRYLVGFFETPAYAVGDSYQGEPVVAVDLDLDFIVVETANVDLLLAKTALDETVRYVEPDATDHQLQLQLIPNDPRWTDAGSYGPKVIKAPVAWDLTLGSAAIKVAIIDSGLRKTHEDIAGLRVLQGWDFYNNDNNPDDHTYCFYHGTHTAGTAAATTNNGKGIAGIAQASVLPIKIFQGKSPSPLGGCASSNTAIINGLKYAGDQGAHVSSNSWGGGSFSTAINDAILYSHNKGTIHVAAAGNSGSCTNCVGEPWKSVGLDKAIVVSASTASDGFATFSSQGPQVDVIAPGDDILSLNGGSDTGYKLMDGTSMSTPHVSGVAALIKTLNPTFTFSQVESRIKTTADNLGLVSDRQGAGRLDAGEAVF